MPATAASSRARTLLDHPLIRKLWKYSMTSVVGVTVGQSLIFLFAGVLGWPAVASNICAVLLSTVPTFLIARHWVWRQGGKAHVRREVAPFFVMSFLGLILSSIIVALLEDRYPDSELVVNIGNLAGFGILWVAKFFVLDRLLWPQDAHHSHGPLDPPPEEIDATPEPV